MASAMKRIGFGLNKNVPEPEVYNVKSGKCFYKFLNKFERYCTYQFSSEKDDWIDLLGKFLVGEIREAYKSIKVGESTYVSIMKSLQTWYEQRSKTMKINRKEIFHSAKMEEDETTHMFAVRLEGFAKAAFGEKFERKALQKFMEAGPASFTSRVAIHNWSGHGFRKVKLK